MVYQMRTFLSVVSVYLICLLADRTATLVAQEREVPRVMPVSESQNVSGTDALNELKQQLLQLSENTLQKVNREGISNRTIIEQEKLQRELELLLRGSSKIQAQSTQERHPPSSSDQTVSNGKEMSSSGGLSQGAGEAAVTKTSENNNGAPLQIRDHLADAVWGHLPPMERNDLVRTYSESYLPEYEDQVRNYFEKLAKLKIGSPDSQPEQKKIETELD